MSRRVSRLEFDPILDLPPGSPAMRAYMEGHVGADYCWEVYKGAMPGWGERCRKSARNIISRFLPGIWSAPPVELGFPRPASADHSSSGATQSEPGSTP